ncbi:ATP-binding cassette domain-containing protein [Streptomyces sp. NPDC003691]
MSAEGALLVAEDLRKAYGPTPALDGIHFSVHAGEVVAVTGPSGIGHKRPGQVSGGQGQRVAVARSLVTSPRVLFANEPTGALDSLNGERVMELFTEAARSTGAAVVLVTHEARVAAYSDREVVVRDGKTRGLEYVA